MTDSCVPINEIEKICTKLNTAKVVESAAAAEPIQQNRIPEYPGPEDNFFYHYFPKPAGPTNLQRKDDESQIYMFEVLMSTEKNPEIIKDLKWGIQTLRARISRPSITKEERQDTIKMSNLSQMILTGKSLERFLQDYPPYNCSYDKCGEGQNQICGKAKSKKYEFCYDHRCFSDAGYP